MAADWEEIKRLAADFQRAQLTSTVQRLSERNCVEIVQRLQAVGLLDVIYTCDGKQYLTHEELCKEIKEELLVQAGRVNLVDLQQTLNVDFNHIESKVNEIVKSDNSLTLILGQLIDQFYLDSIAEQINDKLQEQGQVVLAELTKEYNLPGDFLTQTIKDRLGTLIFGQIDDFDRNTIYTDAFVARHRAKIRGSFSGISKPTSVLNIMNQYHIQERLFFKLTNELINSKRLAGSLTGDKTQYIPSNYTASQNQWIDSFYQQNGYLEYDALRRLGITEPISYVKRRYKADNLIHLSSCSVGPAVRERLESELQVLQGSTSWLDTAMLLPSILSEADVVQLLQEYMKNEKGVLLFCDAIVAGEELVRCCERLLDEPMKIKAEKDAKLNSALLSDKKVSVHNLEGGPSKEDRKEERRKKAASSTKSGMGTQGREVKTKALKKKGYRGRDADHSDGEEDVTSSRQQQQPVLPFLTVDEISKHLQPSEMLRDAPDELITEIAQMLHRPLTQKYQEVARSVFLQTSAEGNTSRKKIHGEMREKITTLWLNAKLFEKGIKLFTADETQVQLCKHLLKTICTDIVNVVFCEIAADNMIAIGSDESQLTPETRIKLLNKVSDESAKVILTKLHTSLNGKSLEAFFEQMELICAADQLGILLKKPDRKKERQLLQSHREMLKMQLREETSAAISLHLACVLLIIAQCNAYVHAPGKCVPQMCMLLKTLVSPEDFSLLQQCQDCVIKQLKQKPDDTSNDTCHELNELLPKVKDLTLNVKKLEKTDN